MKGNQYLTDRSQHNIYILVIYQSTRVITQNYYPQIQGKYRCYTRRQYNKVSVIVMTTEDRGALMSFHIDLGITL